MPRYTFEDPAKFASQVTALDNHKDIFQDQSEEKTLCLIEGQLEKVLVEPSMPNYQDILIEARNRLRDKE